MMHIRTWLMAGTALGLAIASGTDARALMMPVTPSTGGQVAIEEPPPPPTATVTPGGGTPVMVTTGVGDDGSFDIRSTGFSVSGANGVTGTISGGGNVDPDQTFVLSFTDQGAQTTVVAALVTPITPIAGKVSVFGSFSGSNTDNGDGDGGTIFPGLLDPDDFFVQFDINDVIVLRIGPESIAFGPGFPSDSYPFGAFRGSAVIDCATLDDGTPLDLTCNSMSTVIAVTGAGDGRAVAFTAGLNIVPVAEPLTLSMLGLGLIGLGGALRRRSRSA